FTPRFWNSGWSFAMYPSSVVQTGVKSFGCENSTVHESPIQSWKCMGPWVVSASKSGAVSPMSKPISGAPLDALLVVVGYSTYFTGNPAAHRAAPYPRSDPAALRLHDRVDLLPGHAPHAPVAPRAPVDGAAADADLADLGLVPVDLDHQIGVHHLER